MPISPGDVRHVARLARLALSDEDVELFREQLGRILEHAERVTSLDTDDVPPTSHAIPLTNVFRPDEPGVPVPSITQEEALSQAPAPEAGHFRVPRILEDDA
ncbi:MAG: Asp-tRNA(Asn)/Glu-tRNA(Gln) amidotransferase subunit GatC [Actinomycetota bacterium]